MAHLTPFIPQYITVHLGTPNSPAPNVTVQFPQYIKNVGSSEIFPTWPESALRANMYAITTFALNRIFNEHYRARGYNFDITNSTIYDQAYVNGREIYGNIGRIADELFNDYVVKAGQVQPYFTQFCNGTTVTCPGLSQWGTVGLANQGYAPYRILQNYYGNDIGIVRDAPVRANVQTYPGIPLRLGSWSNDVLILQKQLNRISQNYPAIPKIPIGYGIYDGATRSAVSKFQDVFNLNVDGIVGKATWYKIKFIYNSVTGAEELGAGGIPPGEVETIFRQFYHIGDRDLLVRVAQFYLNFIHKFNPSIPVVSQDGVYGPKTAAAVRAFQQNYGLPADGIMGRDTWYKLQQVYLSLIGNLPSPSQYYPGYFITTGAAAPIVRQVQYYLRTIALADRSIPLVTVDGNYSAATKAAVRAFQNQVGIQPSGYVGPLTWTAIVSRYNAYT